MACECRTLRLSVNTCRKHAYRATHERALCTYTRAETHVERQHRTITPRPRTRGGGVASALVGTLPSPAIRRTPRVIRPAWPPLARSWRRWRRRRSQQAPRPEVNYKHVQLCRQQKLAKGATAARPRRQPRLFCAHNGRIDPSIRLWCARARRWRRRRQRQAPRPE